LKLFTFLIYKYAEGGRDFFKEARYNAIKRFFKESLNEVEKN